MIEDILERIAVALEKLAGEAPIPSGKSKSAAVKPAASPSESTTSGAEAAEPDPESDGVSKEDLRAALTAFQEEHGVDICKELIKPFGLTIGKIKAKDFPKVIKAIEDYAA